MRKPLQYILAAFVGRVVGRLDRGKPETLLGIVIGVGVGMLVVFFCHVYPRVGYAEQKIGSPFNRDRRINPVNFLKKQEGAPVWQAGPS